MRAAYRAANWLLERAGVADRNESLMGDLEEEYRAGRSAWWYWWQGLVAVGTSVGQDLWRHKLLALRAGAMGWALVFAFRWFWMYVVNPAVWQLVHTHDWAKIAYAMLTQSQPAWIGWVSRAPTASAP